MSFNLFGVSDRERDELCDLENKRRLLAARIADHECRIQVLRDQQVEVIHDIVGLMDTRKTLSNEFFKED